MERAHVLVRLGDGASAHASARDVPGICRTSATTVRLEHSDMSPGVASITFEQVFDATEHSNAHVFSQGLVAGVDAAIHGQATTVVLSGAPGSGKSFTCHGSGQDAEPGIASLAIYRVFSQLEALHDDTERQVLLSCLHVSGGGELENSITVNDKRSASEPHGVMWRNNMSSWLLEQSVRVTSSSDAVDLYSRARQRSGEQDFVLVLHIEVRMDDGRVRRGRFVCIDVHGNYIVEPGVIRDAPEISPSSIAQPHAPYFEDTHFPINRTLSESFGSFLGNENATYILVAIRKAAQYQQQAIQSLLFACKAKDIRSACRISYLSAFTAITRGTSSSNSSASLGNNACLQDDDAGDQVPSRSRGEIDTDFQSQDSHSTRGLDSPGSPASSASSSVQNNSPKGLPQPYYPSTPQSPATTATVSSAHTDLLLRKRMAVSDRLRKAYEIAKAATSAHGAPSSDGNANGETASLFGEMDQDDMKQNSSEQRAISSRTRALHQIADAILAAAEWRPVTLPSADMSLLQKLELIRLKNEELERGLAHEVTIKEKCVARISKLTQTMGLQVAEHEKQLANALASKQAADAKLRDMEAKFSGVAGEIASLQQQVAVMKSAAASAMTATATTIASDRSASFPGESQSTVPVAVAQCNCKLEERSMLQSFATKLEAAMQDAKSVVDFKDGVIRDLEVRLRDADRRGAESSAQFERAKLQLSSENAALAESLDQLRAELLAKDDHVREETFRTQQDQADLMVKMAQLTLDVETQRKQWTELEKEHEARATKAATNEKLTSQALAQLREAHSRINSDLVNTRRKHVALQAAHQGAMLRSGRLEAELSCRRHDAEIQGLVRKLAKRKAKLDRARTLLADRKQQIARASAQIEQLTQQLEAVAKDRHDAQREATSLKRQLSAKVSEVEGLGSMKRVLEDAVDTLKEQLSDQHDDQEQLVAAEQVMEEATQLATLDALEDQKRELTQDFERRLYELEQSFARRVVVRETQLQKEHDARVRELMERHSAELLQLQHNQHRTCRGSEKDAIVVVNDTSGGALGRRDARRQRRLQSLERQLSGTRTASLSSSSSSRSSSSGAPRSASSPLTPLRPQSPIENATSAPAIPQQQNIRELDALIVEKERRYDQHVANARRTPSRIRDGSSGKSPTAMEEGDTTKQYEKALAKKQREVDELQRRTQQLLNALATANEEETVAKARAEQAMRAQEQNAVKFDALLQELNRVKQENWGLSLALQVTEKARP